MASPRPCSRKFGDQSHVNVHVQENFSLIFKESRELFVMLQLAEHNSRKIALKCYRKFGQLIYDHLSTLESLAENKKVQFLRALKLKVSLCANKYQFTALGSHRLAMFVWGAPNCLQSISIARARSLKECCIWKVRAQPYQSGLITCVCVWKRSQSVKRGCIFRLNDDVNVS